MRRKKAKNCKRSKRYDTGLALHTVFGVELPQDYLGDYLSFANHANLKYRQDLVMELQDTPLTTAPRALGDETFSIPRDHISEKEYLAPAIMSLTVEPSNPQKRADLDLPPKSYATAVEQDTNGDAHHERNGSAKNDGPMPNGVSDNSNTVNGTEPTQNGQMIYDCLNQGNGENLKSIKRLEKYEKHTRWALRDSPARRPGQKREHGDLAHGKRAGEGWHRSGIRFAPLNVPLQRRLQTLLVLWHTLCIPIFVTTFFFLCAIPIFWPALIPYLIYVLVSSSASSGTLKRRSNFLRSLRIWSLFASYFPVQLHRSQPLPPTRKYIFGYHPHGIISHGAFAAFGTEACGFSKLFPGITNTLLTLDANFRIPLYRDYALTMGLGSVSKESCENHLSRGGKNGEGMGRAITIVIGGATESLEASPGTLRLVLRKRKGFVKMGIRQGADLVPVLAFGENELYQQANKTDHPYLHKIQLLVKKMAGFTIPLFHARGVFNYDVGLMPYRRPVHVVVGRPIKVEQQAEPKEAYLEELHAEYVSELERLWDAWKEEYAHGTARLEIVE